MIKSKIQLILILITTGFFIISCGSDSTSPSVTPTITALTPSSGRVGDQILIAGTNFGTDKTKGSISLNGLAVTSISSWTDTQIIFAVPDNATTGNVIVTVNSKPSNGVQFAVLADDFSAYFPLIVGDIWTYDRYKVDESGVRQGDPYKDSCTIVNEGLNEGKQSKIMITFDQTQRVPIDTAYYYQEGSKLFGFVKPLFYLPRTWLNIADFKAASWDVGTITLTNYELYSGFPINGTLKITGSRGINKTFIVNGQSIEALEIKTTLSFDGNAKIFSTTFPAKFTQVNSSYYSRNAGLVNKIDGPINLSVQNQPSTVITGVALWESNLTSYYLKIK